MLADGSVSNQRAASACVRAMDSHREVARRCQRIVEELDEVTGNHGVQTTGFGPDDSVVTTTAALISQHAKKAATS